MTAPRRRSEGAGLSRVDPSRGITDGGAITTEPSDAGAAPGRAPSPHASPSPSKAATAASTKRYPSEKRMEAIPQLYGNRLHSDKSIPIEDGNSLVQHSSTKLKILDTDESSQFRFRSIVEHHCRESHPSWGCFQISEL